MPFDSTYREQEITRDDLSSMSGPVLVEFGANWCGICSGFSPTLQDLFQEFPAVQHIRVEDGRGKPLGRSFRVKLWPTLVFMRDGQVVRQLVRPRKQEVLEGFQAITTQVESQAFD